MVYRKSLSQRSRTRETRTVWAIMISTRDQNGWARGVAYACDEQVDAAAGQEPVHEGALGGHHVRVPARLLRSALMLAER